MVSTKDYTKHSALCLDREMAAAFTGFSPLVTTEVDEILQLGVRRYTNNNPGSSPAVFTLT
jgi:hypothetical protein